ncbi:MAG: hypothetical protein RIA63_02720 [Cyclobacteriaceae bacterium]
MKKTINTKTDESIEYLIYMNPKITLSLFPMKIIQFIIDAMYRNLFDPKKKFPENGISIFIANADA